MAGVFGKLRKTGADLSWTIDPTATSADLEKRKAVERLFSTKSHRFMLSNSQIQDFMYRFNYRMHESHNDGTTVYRKFAYKGALRDECRVNLSPFVIHTQRVEKTSLTFPVFRLKVETKGSKEDVTPAVEPHSTFYRVRNIEQVERILKRWEIIPRATKVKRSKFVYYSDDSAEAASSMDSVGRFEKRWYQEPAFTPSEHWSDSE